MTTITGIHGTRSSSRWRSYPGRLDALNLRTLFPSSNPHGIPDLAPSLTVPANLAAWHVARQRQHAAETGGALHCFLDDYRFETAWSSPERAARRAVAVGCALSPDFSLWRGMPRAASIWNVYRSRWVAAYWQALGVDVIPTVSWSDRESFDYAFAGLEAGGTVAVSSVGVRSGDVDSIRAFRDGLEQVIERLRPSTLLVYGKLRHCEGIELPCVVEYPTHWDRRRRRDAIDAVSVGGL
ncbi:hypothetical protein CH298_13220 [Rhodococcoides fascians]|uniref:DUF4417 domain-containing protein n=1 Tax=Rhodococcoides fascians TaxID=1828 RepID=UPI000B9B8D9A|nr:DUF4417 domain-containing protein [Rhodococcus fascians]OZE89940.1 hypothetical protein CH303_13100 [Rhodococcus fascians]OZF18247.1 hypothetical protein CH298_13220 [Rhodococcus fascians]OZF21698.1 hypothetical protein CH297_13115 [Rhodococcus fascians]OZF67323.1 hypothetical protein CH308_13015 [Rhodococcus fascians]OZF70512.1 hypothetical protein CH307_13210 [Rhodococcus fascians]